MNELAALCHIGSYNLQIHIEHRVYLNSTTFYFYQFLDKYVYLIKRIYIVLHIYTCIYIVHSKEVPKVLWQVLIFV
jgi:hypothetical protein